MRSRFFLGLPGRRLPNPRLSRHGGAAEPLRLGPEERIRLGATPGGSKDTDFSYSAVSPLFCVSLGFRGSPGIMPPK